MMTGVAVGLNLLSPSLSFLIHVSPEDHFCGQNDVSLEPAFWIIGAAFVKWNSGMGDSNCLLSDSGAFVSGNSLSLIHTRRREEEGGGGGSYFPSSASHTLTQSHTSRKNNNDKTGIPDNSE
jgi:hypothetical protein